MTPTSEPRIGMTGVSDPSLSEPRPLHLGSFEDDERRPATERAQSVNSALSVTLADALSDIRGQLARIVELLEDKCDQESAYLEVAEWAPFLGRETEG